MCFYTIVLELQNKCSQAFVSWEERDEIWSFSKYLSFLFFAYVRCIIILPDGLVLIVQFMTIVMLFSCAFY